MNYKLLLLIASIMPAIYSADVSNRITHNSLADNATFIDAVKSGNVDTVSQLIDDGYNINAEDQHGNRVFAPVHLLIGLHAAGAINQPFRGTHNGIEKRAFALKHPRHVDTERTHQDKQHTEEHAKLQPTVRGHFRISPDVEG